MEVSSTPAFCGTCHVMSPYYESWKTSSHADIACVDCHIPPGITAELRKKYEALSMVARYFTATYGTNPWTEMCSSITGRISASCAAASGFAAPPATRRSSRAATSR
jgi:hypothetical protein